MRCAARDRGPAIAADTSQRTRSVSPGLRVAIEGLLWSLVLCLLLGWPAARAQPAAPATPTVQVGEGLRNSVDLWPAVRVLADPEHALDASTAWQRRADFQAPSVPRANFGIERATLWLHASVETVGADPRWILDIAYPALNEAIVYRLQDGVPVQIAHLGNLQDIDARPLPTRTHAAILQLEPGRHEFLVRVRTNSTMVVPLTLSRPGSFYLLHARTQLLQGVAFGIVALLLLYGLAQWVALRDPVYGLYAVTIGASSLFLFSYTGLGQQLVWGHLRGDIIDKIAPLSVLAALATGSIFVTRTLNTRHITPRIDIGLRIVCASATICFVLSVVGVLDYRTSQLAATVLGPPAVLQALPAAFVRSRRGDPVGTYMFIGWSFYAVGALLMAGLLRGVLPANNWTLNAYQVGALCEMLAWLRVLSLRTKAITERAEKALQLRRQLETQARTDPLTGLANRRGLELALEPALRESSPGRDRPGAAGAVFVLDLDGFKPVNDTHGHAVGDLLLRAIAERLQSCARAGDTVARLGGDEFVVYAKGPMTAQAAQALGEHFARAVREPVDIDGRQCVVGSTIGYALARARDADDIAGLLVRADEAMYEGKRAGRGVVRGHAGAPLFGARKTVG
jgi:diguanylate cyclase (GGDEF)-like protein